jgi:hypothetical protein
MVKEVGAYFGIALLAVCIVSVGIAVASLLGGALGMLAGTLAAAETFQVLRSVTGRVVGAAIDSL